MGSPEGASRHSGSRSRPTPPGSQRLAWLAASFLASISCLYAIYVPMFRGPDEPMHADLAFELADGGSYPGPYDRFLTNQVAAMMGQSQFRTRDLDSAQATERDLRPERQELGSSNPSTHANQISQHPPLYYAVSAVVDRAALAWPGLIGWDLELLVLRLMGVAAVGLFPLITATLSRLLGVGATAQRGAILLSVSVPQMAFVSGTVSNDVAINALGTLSFLAYGLLQIQLARQRVPNRQLLLVSIVAGAILGFSLLTKGFALLFLPLVGIWHLYIVIRRPSVRTLGALAAHWFTAFALGGWWWLRNILVYHTIQPSREMLAVVDGFQPDKSGFVWAFVSRFSLSFWGNIGWLELPIGARLSIGLSLGLAILCGIGLLWNPSAIKFALFSPFLITLVVLARNTYAAHSATALYPGMQGRYFFYTFVGLALLGGIGLAQAFGKYAIWAQFVLLIGIGFIHLRMGVLAQAYFFGAEGASLADTLKSASDWSPIPIGAQLVVLAWALLSAGALVIEMVPFRSLHSVIEPTRARTTQE